MGKNVSRKYQKIRYDKANFTNKQIRDLSDLIDTYFNINELYLIDQYRYMRKHGEPELYYEWLKRFKVENFYYLCEGRITVDNISKTILTTILGYTYMSLSFLPHNDKLYPTNYKSSDRKGNFPNLGILRYPFSRIILSIRLDPLIGIWRLL